uniref:Uncharacterized protein n=1 Tax=Caenorhabditis japonica TaxID=281687 RepID=A0A8R1I4G6_CAEJA
MSSIIIITILFCIAVVTVTATYHSSKLDFAAWHSNTRLLRELEMELELAAALKPMSRPRRVPSADGKSCGPKVYKFVMSVCESSCTGNTGLDIATKCCTSTCDQDYIRKACCPNK